MDLTFTSNSKRPACNRRYYATMLMFDLKDIENGKFLKNINELIFAR